jgi:predicted DNA-binding transcriptional regulator AlpA
MLDSPSNRTIDERDASPYIGYTKAALRAWRRQGRGPAYIRINRSIRYRIQDLDDWLQRHRVETEESR